MDQLVHSPADIFLLGFDLKVSPYIVRSIGLIFTTEVSTSWV